MGNRIKTTILIIIAIILLAICLSLGAYIANKNDFVKIPDNPVLDLISNTINNLNGDETDTSKEEPSKSNDDFMTEGEEGEKPDNWPPESNGELVTEDESEYFAGEVTTWPDLISDDFIEFKYGTITHATELGKNDRYNHAWVVEFSNVPENHFDSYISELQELGWEVSDKVTTDIWIIQSASKDDLETSLMLKIADSKLNLELFSY